MVFVLVEIAEGAMIAECHRKDRRGAKIAEALASTMARASRDPSNGPPFVSVAPFLRVSRGAGCD